MHAWIIVREHSFYALSDVNGEFKIPDLKPGQYTLHTWHEEMGEIDQTILVSETASTPVTVSYSTKQILVKGNSNGLKR